MQIRQVGVRTTHTLTHTGAQAMSKCLHSKHSRKTMLTPRHWTWWPVDRHSTSLINGIFQLQWICQHIQHHGYTGAIVQSALPAFQRIEPGRMAVKDFTFQGNNSSLKQESDPEVQVNWAVCEYQPGDCDAQRREVGIMVKTRTAAFVCRFRKKPKGFQSGSVADS